MKKIKKILFIFMFMLMLNGCVKSNTTMTINSDKSMEFELFLIFKKEYEVDLDSKINTNNLTKNGFNISNYEDNGYNGIKITKHYKNIDKLSTDKTTSLVISDIFTNNFNDNELFQVEKGFLKNKYIANYKYNLRSEIFKQTKDIEDFDDTTLMNATSDVSFKYIVMLPHDALKNNANGKTDNKKELIWNLNQSEDNKITFEFELYNKVNMIIVGVGCLLVLIVLIIIIVKITKKIKQNKSSNSGPIHVDYDPSISDKVNGFNIIEEDNLPPEVAKVSESNLQENVNLEIVTEEEKNAKIMIKNYNPVNVQKGPKFIQTEEEKVEEIVDFNSTPVNNIPVNNTPVVNNKISEIDYIPLSNNDNINNVQSVNQTPDNNSKFVPSSNNLNGQQNINTLDLNNIDVPDIEIIDKF